MSTTRWSTCPKKGKTYYSLNKGQKTIREALEFLGTLIDGSDPDTDLPQIEPQIEPLPQRVISSRC